MIFVAALVALHVAVMAWGAVDDGAAGAAWPLIECVMALIGLAVPSIRRGMLDAATRYWPALLALTALVALTLADSGPSAGGFGAHFTHGDAWRVAGFAMGALCAAGAALSAGRRQIQNALLIGAIALGALAVIEHMQAARPLLAEPDEAAAVFALLAALSVYTAIDGLAVRAARPLERRATRAERLFLPITALLSSLIGLTLAGSAPSIAAFGLAFAALTFCLALRERRRGVGLILLGGAAAVSFLGGATVFLLVRRAGESVLPPYVSPTLGFGIAALAWIGFMASLAIAQDRRRRPSRGLGVALAGLVVLVFAGSGGAAPAAFATLALLCGLAAAHADALARVSSESRSSDQP